MRLSGWVLLLIDAAVLATVFLLSWLLMWLTAPLFAAPAPQPRRVAPATSPMVYSLTWGTSKWVITLHRDGRYEASSEESSRPCFTGFWKVREGRLYVQESGAAGWLYWDGLLSYFIDDAVTYPGSYRYEKAMRSSPIDVTLRRLR